jgi:hypothetical protein
VKRNQSYIIIVKARAAATALAVQSKRLKGRQYREANEKGKADTEKKKSQIQSTSPNATAQKQMMKASPSGKIVEVVITTLPPGKSGASRQSPTPSSGAEEPPETEYESDRPRKLPPRQKAKKVMVVSSESEDNDEPAAQKNGKQARKSSAKSGESSDYEGSGGEDSESDFDAAISSDDEAPGNKRAKNVKSKVVSKPKKSLKGKGKASQASSSNDDTDAMDVDDGPSRRKKSTKRKADEENERPAKKQKRSDSDPWKLKSRAVQREWTEMQAPPLEMFHFSRVVVDEYTYLDGKVHALVTRQSADRHWVLSGTPPIHDFAALKTIAAFLNIHLGVDDDGEGQSAEVKKRRREQTGEFLVQQCFLFIKIDYITAVEKFHSFREVHSLEWHANRQKLGQRFLDQFVRQVSQCLRMRTESHISPEYRRNRRDTMDREDRGS